MATRKTAKRPQAAAAKPTKRPATESRHPRMLPSTKAEVAAIARLRRVCMALPDVTEKIAWGEPTWRAGKIFAQMDTHHHGADHVAVWLPARPGVQEELVADDPARYFRPPYVGHKGWIGVRIDGTPDWNAVASLVGDAYRLVASPGRRARLDAERTKQPRGRRATWVDAVGRDA